MTNTDNVYKFFNYVPEDIDLPQNPTVEENVTAKKISKVTDGVEFVPYWRTIKEENGITVIVNDAIRLAIIYFNAKKTASSTNTWIPWGSTTPAGYRPVRSFVQPAHANGSLVRIIPDGHIYYSSRVANTELGYSTSIVYPYFDNHVSD